MSAPRPSSGPFPLERVTFLDAASVWMESDRSPMDFALLAHLAPGSLQLTALQEGARRALRRFPRSACVLKGKSWAPLPGAEVPIRIEKVKGALEPAISQFIARRMDAERALLVEQCLFQSPTEDVLVTRIHHALCDLPSAAAWLGAQLRSAAETEPSEPPLVLKTFEGKAIRRSKYSPGGASDLLTGIDFSKASGQRGWRSVRFDNTAVRAKLEKTQAGFTYNDLLATVLMATSEIWNRERGGGNKLGVWIPVSLRTQPFVGFGNASGRVRVYRQDGWPTSFAEAARLVREQVRWCKDHGEWHVPSSAEALMRVPRWVARGLLERYAFREGVDWSTLLFSHSEKLSALPDAELLPGVTAVEAVAHLTSRHPVVVAGAGHLGQTHITFTWDRGAFSLTDGHALVDLFESVRRRAFDEVALEVFPARAG